MKFTRRQSAALVFFILAGAFITMLSVDFTDTYVADRFHKALQSRQYQLGQPFSLDAFLEYYDWDEMAIVIPGTAYPDLNNMFGLPYSPQASDSKWSIIFVKGTSVVAEIPIHNEDLLAPSNLPDVTIKRWAAIVEIIAEGDALRLVVVGH